MRSDTLRPEVDKLPLLSVEELESAEGVVRTLFELLRARSYRRLARVPGQRSRAALLREPLNWYKFLAGREQISNATALNDLYRRIYLGRDLSLLDELFFRGNTLPREDVVSVLGGELTQEALDRRVLAAANGEILSLLRVTPTRDLLLLSDRPQHRASGSEPVWLGGDSLRLADFLDEELAGCGAGRALDLCSGGGIQSFVLKRHVDEVLGMDLSPRAVAMSKLVARLNDIRGVDFVLGNVTADIEGKYPVIVSNAPFVAMPESARAGNLDGHGGQYGMDLTLSLCESVPPHLEEGGCWYLLTTSPTVAGRDLLVKEMTEIAQRRGLDITLTPITYTFSRHYAAHRLSVGIEYTTNYLARVRNARRGEVKRLPLSALRSLVYRTQVRLARGRARRAA